MSGVRIQYILSSSLFCLHPRNESPVTFNTNRKYYKMYTESHQMNCTFKRLPTILIYFIILLFFNYFFKFMNWTCQRSHHTKFHHVFLFLTNSFILDLHYVETVTVNCKNRKIKSCLCLQIACLNTKKSSKSSHIKIVADYFLSIGSPTLL